MKKTIYIILSLLTITASASERCLSEALTAAKALDLIERAHVKNQLEVSAELWKQDKSSIDWIILARVNKVKSEISYTISLDDHNGKCEISNIMINRLKDDID